jgi:DNA-binding transcriptional LysR family regulator
MAAGEIRLLKVEGLPIKTQWRLIWLKNKQLSPVADAFVKYLRNHKKQIVDKHFQLGK